jgi:putative sterol carrier protein
MKILEEKLSARLAKIISLFILSKKNREHFLKKYKKDIEKYFKIEGDNNKIIIVKDGKEIINDKEQFYLDREIIVGGGGGVYFY